LEWVGFAFSSLPGGRAQPLIPTFSSSSYGTLLVWLNDYRRHKNGSLYWGGRTHQANVSPVEFANQKKISHREKLLARMEALRP